VDATWLGLPGGAQPAPGKFIGCNAFASLADAITAAAPGDTLQLAAGDYPGIGIGKDLTIDGNGAVIHGASPALTVSSGNVTVTNAVLTTATADPTVLVSGGTLTLRNCVVQESTGSDQAAIRITGGSVDLGTPTNPGGNTININSPGQLINNASPTAVPALGNIWQQNGATLASNFAIEDAIAHALDAPGAGLVSYVAQNVYVTTNSGSIQRGVDAAAAGDTVDIAPGTYIEDIRIGKAVALIGPNAGKGGTDPTRGPEAILMPATDDAENGQILYAGASGIAIDGLLFDGDNPALSSGYDVAGVDVNTGAAIQNTDFWLTPFAQIDHLVVRNNVFKNISYDAIYFEVDLGSNHSSNYIQTNKFDNMWEGIETYGPHTVISDNTITNVDRGLSLHGTTGAADAGFNPAILRNQIWIKDSAGWMPGRLRVFGVWVNYRRENAPALDVAQNTVTYSFAVPDGKVGYGLWALTVDGGRTVNFRDNVVNGGGFCNIGFLASAIDPGANVSVTGGSLTGIKDYGVLAGRYDLQYGDGPARLSVSNLIAVTTAGGIGLRATNQGAVTVRGSVIGGAVGIEADGGAVLVEYSALTNSTLAGVRALNGGLVDAGDCSGANITGLGTGSGLNGSSAGANDLTGYGFDDVAPWAIQNLNTSSQPAVRAQQNRYGDTGSQSIEALLYDDTDNAANSAVIFSQATLAVSCPPALPIQCLANVPAGANTLAGFLAQGGMVSSSSATISFSEGALTPGPLEGTISRTYTITEGCGLTTTCTQIITVHDTIPPVITTCATNQTLNAGADCGVVPNVTNEVVAVDNCSNVTLSQSPTAGTLIGSGDTIVTITAADANGNSNTCTLTVTVVGTPLMITAQPQSVTNQVGTTASFTVSASGVAPLGYQWLRNGTNLPGQTNLVINLPNVQPANVGNYQARVTDHCGNSLASLVATLTVNRPPVAGADGFGTLKNTAKSLTTATLLANDTDPDGDVITLTGTSSVSLRGGTVSLAGGTVTYTPPIDFVGGDHFTYTVSDGRGGSAVGEVCINVTLVSLLYSEPNGGWTYAYDGSWRTTTNSLQGPDTNGPKSAVTLDGTWSANNSSSDWDGFGRGPGSGAAGGISSTNGILTVEDLNIGSGSLNNKRIYFEHPLTNELTPAASQNLMDNGITISFRARLTQTDIVPAANLVVPDGWGIFSGGKGDFGVHQLVGSQHSQIGFSLVRQDENDNNFHFTSAVLTMNPNVGDTVAGPTLQSSNVASANPILPLDPNVFHEFWITVQANDSTPGNGTHTVSVYLDGSLTPSTFNVTAASGNDGESGAAANFLAMGHSNGTGAGAYDIDFYGYKPGVIRPNGFNDPIGIVQHPASQTVSEGGVASFNVGVTGTPPYFFQWLTNGVAVPGATNQTYSFIASCGDDNATLTVSVSNLCGNASSAPAVLTILPITPPPSMMITLQGTNVSICWPQPCGAYDLQESENLVPPDWHATSATITFSGTNYCVTTVPNGNKFYRLKKL